MPFAPEPSPDSGHAAGLPDLPALNGLGGPKDLSIDADDGARDSSEVVALVGPTDDDPNLGRTIAGYRLERKIGQGGMGVVYQGRQVSLDRVVAIKILSKALSDNGEFIKRFQREAKSIARINHPNIVAVYDFGSHQGEWFMVNEFIEGWSLAAMISERMVVPVQEFLPLMVHCLAGLAHVELTNIVHRDIKPDNILITKDAIAKIADFGLAKDVNEREGDEHTDLTATGLAMGTPSYMSPEQCMGHKLDGRSDQYAMGVTAYFALTGEKPFSGSSSFEIMTRQREHVPPAPHTLNPSIPPEISELIMQMLAKDPSDRFPDAESCRQAWLSAGESLGTFGSKTRSGEFDALGLRNSARLKSSVALPELPQLVNDAEPPRPSQRMRTPVPATVAPAPAPANRRPASESSLVSPEPTGPVAAIATAVDRSRTPSTGATCPRCGMLNRSDAAACSRCATPFGGGNNAAATRDQEAAAARLIEQGHHREAAAIYSRLADQETDRRAKSILRAKEREARKAERDRAATEFVARARAMADRGDLKGALAILDQGAQAAASSTSSASSEAIDREATTVRERINRRRRIRSLIILAVVVALTGGAAAWWFASWPAPQGAAP